MPHLTLEALARLVDEPPMPDEAIHLADCAACRAAMTDLRTQGAALRALHAIPPAPDDWDTIIGRWRSGQRVVARRRRITRILTRVAASLGLVAIGAGAQALISRETADGPAFPGDASTRDDPSPSIQLLSARRPQTLDDAISRVRAAELVYRRTLLDYSAIARSEPPRDFVARLATLDAIVLTTGTALERAPADPVINTYHLAAIAERETLLEQMR